MITKRPPLHVYDIIFKDTSWEILEKLQKFLGKTSKVEYLEEGYHKNENENGFTVTSKVEILPRVLDNISDRLPEWAKEIKAANEKEEVDSLKEIREWLKKTPIPEAPKKRTLKDLHKVILELREDLENEANKGKVLPCGLGDLNDILNLFKLLEADKIVEAKKAIWEMDTGARDYIPSYNRRLLDGEEE